MFKLTMDDAKTLKNIFDAVVTLIEEGPVEVNEKGLFLRAIDPSQIAMVTLNIPKEAFSEYTIDKKTLVGLNFVNLVKILSRAKTGEKVTLKTEDAAFIISFSGGKRKRTFKVPLLDAKDLITKEVKVDPEAEITLLAGEIKDSLKDAELVSTYLTFNADKDKLEMTVRGDGGKLNVEFEKNNDTEIKLKDDIKNAHASFSLEYMENIVKACPDNNKIKFYMRTDMPLKVEYKVDKADLSYFLAPRREE